MECWSNGIKKIAEFFCNTPTLQYSNTPNEIIGYQRLNSERGILWHSKISPIQVCFMAPHLR